MAGCETSQTNISLHIEERNIPNPKTLGISGFFSARVQKVAFKGYSLK
jgi:hypothetical protein